MSPDLVQKHRPAVRLFEPAAPRRHGAGEGALLVTEELALQELPWDGGAVDRHEGPALAPAVLVDGPGDQLLPGAALPAEQDGADRSPPPCPRP